MKKRFLTVFVLVAAMLLGAISVLLTACSNEEEYPGWDVSAEGSTVTASFSDNGKYGYILTVEGSGAMRDYSSAKDTPWYKKSGRVTDIVISDGITQIGDNAFAYCYYVGTVMLPDSVTKIGANVFPENTKVYSYVPVEVADGAIVYEYSEEFPTTSGYYWHTVDGTPTAWPYVDLSPKNVLFIGNSYTYYNAMPVIFKNLANAAGVEYTVEYITTGSQSLINWADPATEDGARVETALTTNQYDVIFLQEKSTSPVNDDYDKFVSGAKALANRIAQTQENCKVYMYETWGSPAYAGNYGGSIPEMEARLRTAYETVAETIGATVSYVGKAFTYVYENYSDINLYNTHDQSHPTYAGSFLAACVHAAYLGIVPDRSTYNGELTDELSAALSALHMDVEELDAETAELLKQVAYKIVFGGDLPEAEYDLRIAVYHDVTDFTLDHAAQLCAAFRSWCAEKDIELSGVKYTKLTTTKQADYSKEAVEGGYNIAIGFRANSFADHGIESTQIKDIIIKGVSSNRRVAILDNEDEIAREFYYNFMESDTAKLILDPDYVPEVVLEMTVNFVVDGEAYGTPVVLSSASSASAQTLPALPEKSDYTPMGWALTEESQDGEVYYNGEVTYATFASVVEDGEVTLYARYISDDVTIISVNIAVFKRYIDESIIVNLISAFGESYTVGESEKLNVTYAMLGDGSTSAGAFGSLVNAGSYNITFGSGGNIDSTGGVTIKGKKTVNISGTGERTVAYLTDDDATVAFYHFLDTDTAKVILDPDYVPEVVLEMTVSFVVDGEAYGTPVVLSSASSASAQTLPALPEKDNFTPMGWALTEESQEGEVYYNGDVTYATFVSVVEDGEVTLYARYISDDKTVITVNIAVFKRYVDESTIQELIAAFKESYSVNEDEVLNVTYEMLGDDSTGAGDFGGLVNAGEFNITFGSGGNIDSTGGVTIKEKKTVNISVSGERTVAYLTEDEATVAFYEFLDTDTAKKIMNPAYISQDEADEIEVSFNAGEQTIPSITLSNATEAEPQSLPEPTAEDGYYFKGWALTQTVEEGDTLYTGEVTYADLAEFAHDNSVSLYAIFEEGEQTITLVIGYYVTNAIDDDVLETIETAFRAYAAEHGFNEEFTITFQSYTGMTDMNGDAAAGQIDYSINTGKAISDANGIAGTKQQVGSRYVMQIADTEIAALFHEFALQDTTIGSW